MRTDWYWGVWRARAVDTGPAAVTPAIITITNQLFCSTGGGGGGWQIYLRRDYWAADIRYVCASVYYTAPHFGGIIHFNIYIWGKSLTFSRRPFESALVLVLYKPRLRLPTVWNPSLFGYNFLPGCACCARCHWWMTDITGPVLAMAETRFTGIYLLTISCGTIHLSFIDSLVDGCFIERG